MDMSKYQQMFLGESREHLQQMNVLLAGLGRRPSDREAIDALFREAHSVKGMAASMGYERTALLAHQLEELMSGFRAAGVFAPEAAARLQAGFDLLEELLEDIEKELPERDISSFLAAGALPPCAESAPAPAPSPPTPDTGLQVMVKIAAETVAPAARALLVLRELATCGEILGSDPSREQLTRGGSVEMLQVRLGGDCASDKVREILAEMPDVERVTITEPSTTPEMFHPRREDGIRSVRVSTDLLDRLIDLTGEMVTNRYILQSAARTESWAELREALDRQTRLVGDLHHQVLRARMLTLESITGRLPRLVRELARKTGKEIVLRLQGQEVELDRSILEGLTDPLMHLVRNAADHGIEGKGEVSVRAWRERDQVLLEVADNGRGLDPAKLRQKAVELGIVPAAQAGSINDRDACFLICRPGFSTAEEVTETSGRGVGMDVVKASVESLGGSLDIDSAPGAGTRILLRLPVSVAIIHLLLVECAGHQLGIPFTRVRRAMELSRDQLHHRGNRTMALIDNEEVPLLSLRKILGLGGQRPGSTFPVVLTEMRDRPVALVVDRFAGQRQAFIKTLAFPLSRLPGVSGATVLGDGNLVFILDPQSLLGGRTGRYNGRTEEGKNEFDGRAA